MHESFAFAHCCWGCASADLCFAAINSGTWSGTGIRCCGWDVSCTPTLHWLRGWWKAAYTAPRCREQVIKREAALGVALRTLHKAGVEGVMIDVWWGIVEAEPGKYDFSAYRRLLQKIADSGLKAQVCADKCGCACRVCHMRAPRG